MDQNEKSENLTALRRGGEPDQACAAAEIAAHIELRLHERLTGADLCKRFYLNKNKMQALFRLYFVANQQRKHKTQTGKSPYMKDLLPVCVMFSKLLNYECTFHDYLTMKRFEQACRLLGHTGLENSDIAGRVGFSTAQHFCYFFKARSGVTPMEYRKNAENGGGPPFR